LAEHVPSREQMWRTMLSKLRELEDEGRREYVNVTVPPDPRGTYVSIVVDTPRKFRKPETHFIQCYDAGPPADRTILVMRYAFKDPNNKIVMARLPVPPGADVNEVAATVYGVVAPFVMRLLPHR
jgi:hypothetical protein